MFLESSHCKVMNGFWFCPEGLYIFVEQILPVPQSYSFLIVTLISSSFCNSTRAVYTLLYILLWRCLILLCLQVWQPHGLIYWVHIEEAVPFSLIGSDAHVQYEIFDRLVPCHWRQKPTCFSKIIKPWMPQKLLEKWANSNTCTYFKNINKAQRY